MAEAKKKVEATKPTPEEKQAAAEAEVDALVARAKKALDEFENLDQKQVDRIVAKASIAALKEKLTDVLENRSERNRWINHFMQFSTMEEIDRRAVMQLIRSIRVISKDELHIEFNYQDEYKKAVALAEQIAEQAAERKAG